eukprot:12926093-Prorocentrum_lima.AAC.1
MGSHGYRQLPAPGDQGTHAGKRQRQPEVPEQVMLKSKNSNGNVQRWEHFQGMELVKTHQGYVSLNLPNRMS